MGQTPTNPFTPETILILRTAFDISKREVLAAVRKENPTEQADALIRISEPLLDDVAAGLLNALATGTDDDFIKGLATKTETERMFCQYCLKQAADIVEKMETTE